MVLQGITQTLYLHYQSNYAEGKKNGRVTQNKMKTFQYYQQIKKSAVKTLVENGVNVRDAFNMVRANMPYVFFGKKRLDAIDESNKQFDIYLDSLESSHP